MINFKRTFLAAVLQCSAVLAGAQTTLEPFAAAPAAQRSALGERLDAFVEAYGRFEWGTLYDLISDAGRRGISEKLFDHAMFEGDNANTWSYHLYAFRPVRTSKVREDVYNVFGCVSVTHNKTSEEHIGAVRAVFEHNNWFFTNWIFADPMQPCSQLSAPDWKPVNPVQLEEPMSPLTCYVNLCTL
jgi:hypothetical protein